MKNMRKNNNTIPVITQQPVYCIKITWESLKRVNQNPDTYASFLEKIYIEFLGGNEIDENDESEIISMLDANLYNMINEGKDSIYIYSNFGLEIKKDKKDDVYILFKRDGVVFVKGEDLYGINI